MHWREFCATSADIALARSSMARNGPMSGDIACSEIRFGPSLGAVSGASCVSMNRAPPPTARASTGANSRIPPLVVPCPPG